MKDFELTWDECEAIFDADPSSEENVTYRGTTLTVPDENAAAVQAIIDSGDYLAAHQAGLAAVAYIPARRAGYVAAYDKTGQNDSTNATGFLLDDLLGFIESRIAAGELTATPEMDAVLEARQQVKDDNPKP